MAQYKIGQILTAKQDTEMESLMGRKIAIPKGSRVIIGADKLAHHFSNKFMRPLGAEDTVKGYDVDGIAEWLYRYLSSVYELDRMLEDEELTRHDFMDTIKEAPEEIGFEEE